MNLKRVQLLILLPLVVSFFALESSAIEYGTNDNLNTFPPSQFEGQPLKNWPRRFLVERTPLMDIFWNAKAECADRANPEEYIPEIKSILDLQAEIKSKVIPLILNLNTKLERMLPKWKERVSNRLFPIDVEISLGDDSECASANIVETTLTYDGLGNSLQEVKSRPVLTIGTVIAEGEEVALSSLKLHELGHLIARTIGVPKLLGQSYYTQATLEESFADFVSTYAHDFSPLMGPGMGRRIIHMMELRLAGPSTLSLSRSMAEGAIASASLSAMRDLRNKRYFYEIYELSESHNVSSILNHVTYRLSQFIDPDILAQSFIETFLNNKNQIMDANLQIFVGLWKMNLFKKITHERQQAATQILSSLGWLTNPVELSGTVLPLEIKSNQEYHTIPLEFLASLRPKMANITLRAVEYTVRHNNRVIFWSTELEGFPGGSAMRLDAVGGCGIPFENVNFTCICKAQGVDLQVEAIFLGLNNEVTITEKQNLPISSFSGTCFKVSPGE